MSTSISAASDRLDLTASDVVFPTETEIYILPDGRVIFADLPAELIELIGELGLPQPCALRSAADEVPDERFQTQPAP